jgi:radical SAM protein with 4Fe4S-binding SPASM domain
MKSPYTSSSALPELTLWEKIQKNRKPHSFYFEITSRCNNDCRHCYINLPSNDREEKKKELSVKRIEEIAEQAVSMGALWCTITGGEPLMREDFFDVYLTLKKKGLLLSIFTNANLITDKHIQLFKKFPPRDIDVSVYGVTQKTYEKITRKPGSFKTFRRGVDLLIKNGIKVNFKAMALQSNFKEMTQIAEFCRERSQQPFRFDPFLNLRFDNDPLRNKEIISERLSPQEIVTLEQQDAKRLQSLKKHCDSLIHPEFSQKSCRHVFYCGAGTYEFTVSSEGLFRLCPTLVHQECVYDLKKGNLKEAWEQFVPKVRARTSNRKVFLNKCAKCPIINLCMWCPANAHLETGHLDKWVKYFCDTAFARADALKNT